VVCKPIKIQDERERERERLCNKRKKRIFPLLMSDDTFRWYNFSKRGARGEILGKRSM
jgi:hypothetical protein